MNILIVNNTVIPALRYGGTERVIWYLGKELVKLGHNVSYLVKQGSWCDFANVIFIDELRPIADQIPDDIDVVHLNFNVDTPLNKPYIVTVHGNRNDTGELDINSVFVSKNHAERYGSQSFVYNGLDWEDYGNPMLDNKRNYFHFLGDAAWRVKNIKGAINVILNTPKERLAVLGGTRLNLRMGFRLTLSPRIRFYGMVGGEKKLNLLQNSKGMVFPVRWHEPFGLALTESLYFGCPVLGTPYGSLPEIINNEVGFLSSKSEELTAAAININSFSRKHCHQYARDCFNSQIMAHAYLEKYETVLNGNTLNAAPPRLQIVQDVKFLPWE